MAHNFRIRHHRKCDGLHLDLIGDFDGSSAMELINDLEKHANGTPKIYVNTRGLSSILPFGEALFKKRCRLAKTGVSLVFTGKYGGRMA